MDEGLQAEEGDLRKRDRFIKQYKESLVVNAVTWRNRQARTELGTTLMLSFEFS